MATTQAVEKDTSHMERIDPDNAIHSDTVPEGSRDLSGYWTSWRLIGSVLAIALMGNSLFVGYAMPVRGVALERHGS